MTSGAHDDGELGEIFLKLGKQGSTLAGVMDAFSIAVSIGLQYGVPLETYVSKFTNLRFEPAGLTDDPDVRMAQSIMDYIFRRLALDYLSFEDRSMLGIYSAEERQRHLETGSYEPVEETGSPSELLDGDDTVVEGQGAAPVVEVRGAPATSLETTTEDSAPVVEGQGGAPVVEVQGGAPVVEVRGASASGTSLETTREETHDTHGSEQRQVPPTSAQTAHTSAELLEQITGTAVDSPLCMTCGTKMRPAGSCYVCEGCGSTSGCS